MATTTASGPLDELIALHIELGVFDALDQRQAAERQDELAGPLRKAAEVPVAFDRLNGTIQGVPHDSVARTAGA